MFIPSSDARTRQAAGNDNPRRPSPLFGLGLDGAIALIVIVVALAALVIRAFG